MAALALVCGGCVGESSDASDAALSLGGDAGTLCVPVAEGGEYTYAFEALHNMTSRSIRVDKVSLVGAKNATAEGGYLAPIVDGVIGAMPGWPPVDVPAATFAAKKAIPASVEGGANANLIVHLKASGPAEFKAVEVTYTTDGGKARKARSSTVLQIRPACF